MRPIKALASTVERPIILEDIKYSTGIIGRGYGLISGQLTSLSIASAQATSLQV